MGSRCRQFVSRISDYSGPGVRKGGGFPPCCERLFLYQSRYMAQVPVRLALGSAPVPCDEVLRYVVRWPEEIIPRGLAVPTDAVLYLLVPLPLRDDAIHSLFRRFGCRSFVLVVHGLRRWRRCLGRILRWRIFERWAYRYLFNGYYLVHSVLPYRHRVRGVGLHF